MDTPVRVEINRKFFSRSAILGSLIAVRKSEKRYEERFDISSSGKRSSEDLVSDLSNDPPAEGRLSTEAVVDIVFREGGFFC